MVVLYHFCNFISILIFNFVNFIQKYIPFLCTFTCFSLFCGFLAPFLTSFSCFSISNDLKYHFRIFMSLKFYGNLLHLCVAFPVRFCRSPVGLVGRFSRTPGFPGASRPHHRLLPFLLGLFQKYTAKVPVCLLKIQFFNRPWAYIKFVNEKSLSFTKYVGLCQNKPGAVPMNHPWL